MQELILLLLFFLALYYLYRKLIRNRGCDCSSKGCCTPLKKPTDKQDPKDDV